MVLNIHGLDGSGRNKNYRELVKLYGEEQIISPQLDYRSCSTEGVLDILEKVLPDRKLLVGKSLGGFFAAYLSAARKIPCILVNPCLRPDLYLDKLMDGYLAENRRTIEKMMREIGDSEFLTENAHMILGRDDELLDPKDAQNVLPEADTVMLPGGHDIEGKEFSRAFAEMAAKAAVE